MYPEGRTYQPGGKPYYVPNAGRDRYLRDLKKYNNQPWYRRMWQNQPEPPDLPSDQGTPRG